MRTANKWMPLICVAAVMTAGCSSHREFRVASVGSDGSFEIAGDDDDDGGSSGGTPLAPAPAAPAAQPQLVTSGNVLIGGGAVTGSIVNGTVAAVLGTTGQTLVKLVDGTSVVLNGSGASLGDLVSIDVGAGEVVGGPSGLLNVTVATSVTQPSTSGTGSAPGVLPGVTQTLLSGPTASTGVVGGTTAPLLSPPSATGSVTGAVASPLLSPPSASGSVTGTVKNSVSGTVGAPLGGLCC